VNLLLNPYVKNTLSALAVTVFTFLLWNLTFGFYALLDNGVRLVFPPELARTNILYQGLVPGIFLILLALMGWAVLKSKLPDLVIATWLTVPLTVLLVLLGAYTHSRPALTIILGVLVVGGFLEYLRETGRSWIYYYALLFTAITLAVFTLMGGEI
jgi:hypothetical protein